MLDIGDELNVFLLGSLQPHLLSRRGGDVDVGRSGRGHGVVAAERGGREVR